MLKERKKEIAVCLEAIERDVKRIISYDGKLHKPHVVSDYW
jgi:hypothetical protein